MKPQEIFEVLRGKFGENASALNAEQPSPFIQFDRAAIREMMSFLRDDPRLKFDFLLSISCVDYPKDNLIRVVYHLDSTIHRHTIALKTDVPRDKPVVRSVLGIWKAADWHEREGWDLMGVTFDGHPNLTRLLMPEDWEGHPLRKDYQQPAFYHGVPTSY